MRNNKDILVFGAGSIFELLYKPLFKALKLSYEVIDPLQDFPARINDYYHIIFILSPAPCHFENLEFIKRNRIGYGHIILEKPAVVSSKQYEIVTKDFNSQQLRTVTPLRCTHLFNFLNYVGRVAVNDGTDLQVHLNNGIVNRWTKRSSVSHSYSNAVWDIGPHYFDLLISSLALKDIQLIESSVTSDKFDVQVAAGITNASISFDYLETDLGFVRLETNTETIFMSLNEQTPSLYSTDPTSTLVRDYAVYNKNVMLQTAKECLTQLIDIGDGGRYFSTLDEYLPVLTLLEKLDA